MKIKVTVVIPTFNEADAIQTTVLSLMQVFGKSSLQPEILVVDDSTDEKMVSVLEWLAQRYPLNYIHREKKDRTGLGSAILLGMKEAQTQYVAVMDADGQHPSEAVVRMLEYSVYHGVDLLLGTRYAGVKEGTAGLDGFARVFYSNALRWFPKVLFSKVRRFSDPLSGLFVINKDSIDWGKVNPLGWKISLEMILFCTGTSTAELPYEFQPRTAGESKANIRVGIVYFMHVFSLVWRYYKK